MFRKPPPGSVTDITETDLWSSLRIPPGCPAKQGLASAIEHGLAGRTAQAYASLAAYHRTALADEWQYQLEEAQARPKVDPKLLRDTLNHKINCWHKQTIQFEQTIDWNPPSLASVGGFHYFGFFRPVVDSYLQTGSKECEAFITDIITQYKAYEKGKNWTPAYQWIVFNQLGASHKFEHWLPAYLGLINQGELSTGAAESFIKHFLGFGRALKVANKEFIPHHIPPHGCRCLMTLAQLFPEFKESPSWNRLGTQRIYEQAVKGFQRDGGHFERVWGYGSYTLNSVGEAYKAARRYGGLGNKDKPMLKAIRRAYRFFAKTLGPAPEYRQPTFGDSGQGSMKAVLERGREFFSKGTNLALGVDRAKSCLLRDSGFAIMRNGDDQDSAYVNLSFGKYAGWHSHQDLLSMNFWAYGQPLLEEAGRFGPYEMPLDTLFRAPESHNLLTIDGMVYNCQGIKAGDVVWHSTDEADYFSATHWAYHYFCYGRGDRSGNSPNIEGKVRRTVVFVKDPGYVLVLDSVLCRFPDRPFGKAISQNWHSPFEFRQIAPAIAVTEGRAGCILAFAREQGLARLETAVDFSEDEGSQWGAAYDRYSLRARRWLHLAYTGTVGFATLLYPFRSKRPEVTIKAAQTNTERLWRAETYEIETPAGKDVITLDPERLGVKPKGNKAPPRAVIRLGNQRGTVLLGA